MTNLEALKLLLEAVGGDPAQLEDGATNADVIAAIAEAYKSQKSEEPLADQNSSPKNTRSSSK